MQISHENYPNDFVQIGNAILLLRPEEESVLENIGKAFLEERKRQAERFENGFFFRVFPSFLWTNSSFFSNLSPSIYRFERKLMKSEFSMENLDTRSNQNTAVLRISNQKRRRYTFRRFRRKYDMTKMVGDSSEGENMPPKWRVGSFFPLSAKF